MRPQALASVIHALSTARLHRPALLRGKLNERNKRLTVSVASGKGERGIRPALQKLCSLCVLSICFLSFCPGAAAAREGSLSQQPQQASAAAGQIIDALADRLSMSPLSALDTGGRDSGQHAF